jgi:CelD/BcsL family acetyltransferase involved in cellulose biosynthesis
VLRVERIEDLAGLKEVEKPWRDLLQRFPHRSLSLTHEWTLTWWEYFGEGRELWLLVVFDGPDLVGIAPMALQRCRYGPLPYRELGFPRNQHVWRPDLIVPEDRGEVVRALTDYWRRHRRRWEVLRLVDVPRKSGSMALLSQEARNSGLTPFPIESGREIGYLPTSGTWDDYLQRKSRRFRKRLRHSWNHLNSAGRTEFRREAAPAEADASMTTLLKLHTLSWKGEASDTTFSTQDKGFLTELARRFAAQGGFENRFLYLNGTPIGGLHCLIYDGVNYFIVIYYDPRYASYGPGTNLIGNALRECFADERIRQVDFNGTSSFIRYWTDHFWWVETMRVYSSNPYARGAAMRRRLLRLAF